jgi:hypothetical protein
MTTTYQAQDVIYDILPKQKACLFCNWNHILNSD